VDGQRARVTELGDRRDGDVDGRRAHATELGVDGRRARVTDDVGSRARRGRTGARDGQRGQARATDGEGRRGARDGRLAQAGRECGGGAAGLGRACEKVRAEAGMDDLRPLFSSASLRPTTIVVGQ
jgi:hypothetical protein